MKVANVSFELILNYTIMKNLLIIILCCYFNQVLISQNLKEIDFISPFSEDLAAIQKNNQWAFINGAGDIVIEFRDDLVATEGASIEYPIFKEDRCMIKKLIDDNFYYGYIDENGNSVIKPQFLNVTNFNNGYAIIIKHNKTSVGNNVLSKKIVSYKLEEYIIDTSGKIIKYLDNARSYNPSLKSRKRPPSFQSKFIGSKLIAVKNKNEKWDIYPLQF